MNRVKHSINGVDFVPKNKNDFSLNLAFNDEISEWSQAFNTSNKVVLPQEGYLELQNSLNNIGVQQMPSYLININGQNNRFFVDLYSGISVKDTLAEVSIKNFISKDNVKTNIDNTTFEWLYSQGKITIADWIKVPYVVIEQDQGSKLLNIGILLFVLTKELIDTIKKTVEATGDLIAAVTPSPAPPTVATNIGLIIRLALMIAVNIAISVLLTLAIKDLIKQAIDILFPPLRYFNAMTFDKLLKIGLASQNLVYSSSLSSHFSKCTIIPTPILEQSKKFFQILPKDDTRVLNVGYPRSTDTTPTVGSLINEICKMFNIQPTLIGNVLHLEPKSWNYSQPMANLDKNMNNEREQEYSLDLSRIWNTKIISYQNDQSDLMLFDNPKGLRCEYKSVPTSNVPNNELTIIKGLQDIRLNFALGTIKKETKLEEGLKKMAKTADKLLGTSFLAKLQKRDGVLAISQPQFFVTKMIYQIGGKQVSNYTNVIGANALYNSFHKIDEPKNQIFRIYNDMPIRCNNEQFLNVLQNKIVNLEGEIAETISMDYNPENARGQISYRVRDLEMGKNITTKLVYNE